MGEVDTIVYETWLGLKRRHIVLTKLDYELWKYEISIDEDLLKIQKAYNGEIRMIDLDEGEAGIFHGWIFPFDGEVGSKLDVVDAGARQAIAGSLQSKVLKDLGFR